MGKTPRKEGFTNEELEAIEKHVRELGKAASDPQTTPLQIILDPD